MAVETIIPDSLENLVKGLIGIIAALGGIILLYLIFSAVDSYLNRKKVKELKRINNKLDQIIEILVRKRVRK